MPFLTRSALAHYYVLANTCTPCLCRAPFVDAGKCAMHDIESGRASSVGIEIIVSDTDVPGCSFVGGDWEALCEGDFVHGPNVARVV